PTPTGRPAASTASAFRKALAPAPASHARPLLSECGVHEGLERFVQRRKLVRDAQELLVRVDAPGQLVHLVAQAIEAFEQRVELAVADLTFHKDYLRAKSSARVRTTRASGQRRV